MMRGRWAWAAGPFTRSSPPLSGRWVLWAAVAALIVVLPSSLYAGVDRDGYADLVIGAPGEDIAGIFDAGSLDLLYGSATGIDSERGDYLSQFNGLLGEPGEEDQFACALAIGDFDGDGYQDLAVGVPGETVGGAAGAGAVHVLHGSETGLVSAGSQLWSQDSPNVAGTSNAGDSFGGALAAGDFNGDGYADLAVGVPGEDLGVKSDNGAVTVLYGSATGVTGADSRLWQQDELGSGTEDGDEMGSALATGDFDGDGYADLAVGTPKEDLDGATDAGLVDIIYGSAQGLAIRLGESHRWFQSAPGVADRPEADDAFGFSLAAGDFNCDTYTDLAIGVPQESLAAATPGEPDVGAGGAVHVLFGGIAGLTGDESRFLHQGSPEIGEQVEPDDRFGWSLAAGDFSGDGIDDLTVGVPYEDDGSGGAEDTGIVQVIHGSPTGPTGPGQIWDQDVAGVDNSPEHGDLFGHAVAAGDFNGDGISDLAIGAPFDKVDNVADAGSVSVLFGAPGGISASGSGLWYQGAESSTSLRESGDRYGWSLAAYPRVVTTPFEPQHFVFVPLALRGEP